VSWLLVSDMTLSLVLRKLLAVRRGAKASDPEFVFVMNTADGNNAGIYLATLAGANVDDFVDAEIQLLGIVSDNIAVATDLLFV
jgi:hypothetical protein